MSYHVNNDLVYATSVKDLAKRIKEGSGASLDKAIDMRIVKQEDIDAVRNRNDD